MRKYVLKLLLLFLISLNFIGCSLWDWENGHDDDDDAKKVVNQQLTDKDIENINEYVNNQEKNQEKD